MATDFVDKFKRYLEEDGKSPKTIESYVDDIAGFVAYLKNMGVKFQGELIRFYVTRFRTYLIESQYETAIIVESHDEIKRLEEMGLNFKFAKCDDDEQPLFYEDYQL